MALTVATLAALSVVQGEAAAADLSLSDSNRSSGIWLDGVGEGFVSGLQSVAVEAGASQGAKVFDGLQHHDLALASVSYGRTFGRLMGDDRFYRGNWEWRVELWGGSQFSPQAEWVVGLTPHIRYDFAVGGRFVPFLDAGAGVSGTGIRQPDLGGPFEFNLQFGAGCHWFVKDDMALTLEVRYMHLSSADIYSPNNGVNTFLGMIGVTFFF